MSLPSAFLDRVKAELGAEFPEFEASLEQDASVSIRLNPAKLPATAMEVAGWQRVPWSRYGWYLPKRPSFTLDPALHAGAYYVQEPSSMLLEQAWRQHVARGRWRILDLCGAPGGKSTHLASLMESGSLLVANEVIKTRAHVLSENLRKWGIEALILNNDPAEIGEKLPQVFDIVVADVPCSGEGLFRKDLAAADNWSEEAVNLCAARQRRIVHDAWPALKPGGLFIYSTCTLNAQENEENLAQLAKVLDVTFKTLQLPSEWGIEEVTHGKATGYRCWPHKVRGEGFFLAVFAKAGEAHLQEPAVFSAKKKKKGNTLPIAPAGIAEQVALWMLDSGEITVLQWKDEVGQDILYAVPKGHEPLIEHCLRQLRVVQPGTDIVMLRHKDLNPQPGLALWQGMRQQAFSVQELPYEEALKYLRREVPDLASARPGWQLMKWQGYPLGWAKQLNNRINNYYPKPWRIRMSGSTGEPEELPGARLALN